MSVPRWLLGMGGSWGGASSPCGQRNIGIYMCDLMFIDNQTDQRFVGEGRKYLIRSLRTS